MNSGSTNAAFLDTPRKREGAIPNGEQVKFSDGSKSLGSVSLVNGVATLTTSSLSVKQHTVKASYAGDLIFKASKGSVIQLVEP